MSEVAYDGQIKQVAVIGAGTMGAGIASVICAHHPVVLIDVSAAQLDKARGSIEKTLTKWGEKGVLTPAQVSGCRERLTFKSDMAAAGAVDLVVEAVPENMAIKQAVFGQLARVVRRDAVVASNTSGLSISAMAALLENPGRVLGVHFFNPVPVMKLVEVIRGVQTDAAVFAATYGWIKSIGKEPVEVKEFPGFVVNRILIPMINEAACALGDGVASAADIDTAMRLGANHPIGPLALADLIGLDVCLAIIETLRDGLSPQSNKYAPAPVLKDLVAAGKLGRKTGSGFFNY